jgi:hypothetical protein
MILLFDLNKSINILFKITYIYELYLFIVKYSDQTILQYKISNLYEKKDLSYIVLLFIISF